MSLLRFLVLPLRAPLLLVLFGVAVFLGHHWSIESEHLIAFHKVSPTLFWTVEVLQSQQQTSNASRPASGWSTLRRACPRPSANLNVEAAGGVQYTVDGQPVPQEPPATLPLSPTRPPAMQRERRRAPLPVVTREQ